MKVNKIFAKEVLDSRGEKTICVVVNGCKTSAPAGKSTGKYEVRSYAKSLKGDVDVIKKIDIKKIDISCFEDLIKVERLVSWNGGGNSRIGGNSLFALEASLLKALAKSGENELWELLSELGKGLKRVKMRAVGNAVGGGLHSKGVKGRKPDFQEFLFIANGKSFAESVRLNRIAYRLVGKFLKARRRNDEGAWETGLGNEEVLDVMRKVADKLKIDIGLDVAGSSFYRNGEYCYSFGKLSRGKQIDYINELIDRYRIYYIEDGLEENDFSGFGELNGKRGLVVGDDLIVTNPSRLKRAIRVGAVNSVIVKPNQIGSLLKVKEIVEIAKRGNVKCVISHRSGETLDDTIADLGVGFGCDFIKTGIYGGVREVKLKRVVEIEKGISR